jgi:hypothetical protein
VTTITVREFHARTIENTRRNRRKALSRGQIEKPPIEERHKILERSSALSPRLERRLDDCGDQGRRQAVPTDIGEEDRQPFRIQMCDIETIIAVSMTEDDIEGLMDWPHTNICTDGELMGAHPRGFGSFPRVLAHYVRERQALGLEEAIHKMTALSAAHVGLTERGRIEEGAIADLVLFDPETVQDRATAEEPNVPSNGIEKVWVNGQLVYQDGQVAWYKYGRVLRRQSMSGD